MLGRRLSKASRCKHVVEAGKGKGPGGVDILAKTSVMCGVGETDEIRETMQMLRMWVSM